jgi:hypothetical protein
VGIAQWEQDTVAEDRNTAPHKVRGSNSTATTQQRNSTGTQYLGTLKIQFRLKCSDCSLNYVIYKSTIDFWYR